MHLQMHASLEAQCQLLSDFKQDLNMETDFTKSPQYKILWEPVRWFSTCYMQTDGRTDAYRCIFIAFRCETAKKERKSNEVFTMEWYEWAS
jgi:hypothetical protein